MPTGQQYSSVATQATLTGGISASNPTCGVNTTSGFPATPFTGVFDIGTATQEIVDVTNVSSLTLTITRGVDGSAAQAHSNGATFTHSAIARDFREARAHMDTGTASSGTPIHNLAVGSSVVGTTDTQTLTNKTLTTPTINTPTISNPGITGTVTGGASYTSPGITGTVSGGATYTTPTLVGATASSSAVGVVPLTVSGFAGQTADLVDANVNGGSNLFKVSASGLVTGAGYANTGLTGAVTPSRYVGATAGGAPTTGTFLAGDWVMDTVYNVMWMCMTGGTPGTWTPVGPAALAEQSLSGTAASVTFSSIPAFNFLTLRFYARSDDAAVADSLLLRINGDATATHYVNQKNEAKNTTVAGTNLLSSSMQVGTIPASTGTANYFAGGAIEFQGWSDSTNFLNVSSPQIAASSSGNSWAAVYGGVFVVSNPRTSIMLFPQTGNFIAGSRFALYGWM